MKPFVTILSFLLLCIQLSAQEKIEASKLISDVCEKNISVDEFKKQYSDYFTEDCYTGSTNFGIFTLQNISFAGYESDGVVFISSDANIIRRVFISPNHEALDSVSRYQVADKCHEYLLEVLGQPANEENISLDEPLIAFVAKELNLKEATTYEWFNDTATLSYSAKRGKTDKEDVYELRVTNSPSLFAITPIQRQFFKTLEFGKNVTKNQIATALKILSYKITEERNSYGLTFHCWEPVHFGGVKWSFLEIDTVDDKLATVRLISSQLEDNKDVYDTLLEALTDKYGTPTEGDTLVLWGDGLTAVLLSYEYGKSKGGTMRHYVNLEYTDLTLFKEAQNIIQNEL